MPLKGRILKSDKSFATAATTAITGDGGLELRGEPNGEFCGEPARVGKLRKELRCFASAFSSLIDFLGVPWIFCLAATLARLGSTLI